MTIPYLDHYAVITTNTTIIPGDERSRTNPGHGYPEHSVDSLGYRAFPNEEKLIEYLLSLSETARTKARVLKVIPMNVHTEVKLSLT